MAPPAIDVKKAVGFKSYQNVAYNSRDLMLYAYSIGIRQDELRYLFERDANFSAFPTYPLVLGLKGENTGVAVYEGGAPVPGIPPFNPNMLVHGEQSITIHRTLPAAGGVFTHETTVTGVYDKGKGTVIERTTVMFDPKEPTKPYNTMVGTAFIRGFGGWNGPKGPAQESYAPPQRPADKVYADKTSEDLAILYRLSGDYNIVHIDPELAPKIGFPKPILHGLCSYGHTAHAVLKSFGNGKAEAMKSITGRFASIVLPGDTLETRMWQVPSKDPSEVEIIFQTWAKERNVMVISAGRVLLHANKSKL